MVDRKTRRKRRKRDYIGPALALVCIIFAAWAYARRAKTHAEPSDPAALRASLLKEIPKDTRLTDAQRTMQEWGFQCMTLTRSVFQGQGPFDFLYCDRNGASGKRWQVALVESNGGVQDILVQSGIFSR